MDAIIQSLIQGILLGGFYAAMVLGFSIIWGVMGVINLAHGEYLMIGAYLAWLFSTYLGLDPFVSLVLIMPIMFVVGYAIQRLLINRVVERPHLMALLVTFGLGIAMANVVKLLYTSDPKYLSLIHI